jgi:serine/threonine protein phosphatase 1
MAGPLSVPDQIDGPLLVIGDVHGEDELLERLLAQVLARADCAGRWLVFVGDLIDRGPNPRAVVQRVIDLHAQRGQVAVCMGNHELALLGALGLFTYPPSFNWDYRYAGHYDSRSTCLSYVPEWRDTEPTWPGHLARGRRDIDLHRPRRRALFERLRQSMAEAHRNFLLGLPWCVRHPDYLIVHAGLRPDAPLAAQLHALGERDFTNPHIPWLCERELIDDPLPVDCPLTVISGHVRVPRNCIFHPYLRRKICIDTGSGSPEIGGCLSAVLLPEREVISVDYHTPPQSSA